jgi:hypothetical protein
MRGKKMSITSIHYWMNARKKTIDKFLSKNKQPEYETKKKKLICEIHKRLK